MASLEVIRRLTIRAQAEGFEDAAQKLQSLGRAHEGVIAATERTEKSTGRLGQSFARIEGALDPTAKALQQYERTLKVVGQAEAQGLTTRARANELLAAAEQRVIATARAHQTMAKQTTLARNEMVNLAQQANDVAVSLAGGQSPLLVLAQQGGQIADVFVSSKASVSDALKSIGSGIATVLTPARLAIGGVAAAAVYGATAWSRYDDAQREVAVSLAGLGRGSGLTRDNINQIAQATAAASDVSVATAREMTSAFAATGKIGGEAIQLLNTRVKDFAATTGQDIPAATAELAKAFADPGRGAEELNQKLGILTAGQLRAIQAMAASGQTLEAQRALVAALAPALIKASEATGFFAREWDIFKQTASNVDEAIGRLLNRQFGKMSATERLEELATAAKNAVAVANTLPPAIAQQNDPRARFGATSTDPEMIRRQNQAAFGRAEAGPDPVALAQEDIRRQNQLAFAQASAQRQREQSETQAHIARMVDAYDDQRAALFAVSTEQKAAAAAQIAYSRTLEQTRNVQVANTAAVIAYDQALDEAALAQRDFNKQLQLQQQVGMRNAQAALASAGGTIAQRNSIQAAAQAQNQIDAIRVQNPNLKIDEQAIHAAAQEIARLGTAAQEAATGIGILRAQNAELASVQTDLAEATGRISKADAIREREMNRANAAIAASGLEGTRWAERIRSNAEALGEFKVELDKAKSGLGTFAYELERGGLASAVQGALGKTPPMTATVPLTGLGPEAFGGQGTVTVGGGSGLGFTGWAPSQAILSSFQPNAKGQEYFRQQQVAPQIADLQAKLQYAQSGGPGDAILAPLTSAIKSLADKASSTAANDNLMMANASKADPRMDPYLARNASVYYGTETDNFYKQVSYQEAQIGALQDINGTNSEIQETGQEQLGVLQQTLEAIRQQYGALTDMPGNIAIQMSQQIADALRQTGLGEEANEALRAGQIYALNKQISDLENPPVGMRSGYQDGYNPSGTGEGLRSDGTSTSSTTPLFGRTAFLGSHATGADFIVPGIGSSDIPFGIGLTPGERVEITPRGGRQGRGVTINQNMTVIVNGVQAPERVPDAVKGLVSNATRQAQQRAMGRVA